jgi:hypothetical protein
MARIRTIKPEFPQSESMGRVSRDARLLFIMLWTVADDFGRSRASSRMLASLLFPYDDDAAERIPGWLKELEREKCVRVYEVDGNTYLQIEKWSEHQRIDHPSKSKFPNPPEKIVKPREKVRNPRSGPRKGKDQGPEDQGLDLGGGEAQAPSPPEAAPFIALPTIHEGQDVPFTEAQIADYAATFPAVDVPQQFREMRRWLLDNPKNRKTPQGMARFVNAWLGKEQDRGGGQRAGPSLFGQSRPAQPIVKVVQ